MSRRAVVLMNLGGPDSLDAVRPFLFNLFSDRAIIDLPAPFRQALAWLIAARRAPTARQIYTRLGGASPLLANTEAQARALELRLDEGERCYVAMRYWTPLTAAVVSEVAAWRPQEILCLPLYPQFSTTTTGSSIAVWCAEAARQGLSCPMRAVHSYPKAPGFVAAIAELIGSVLVKLPSTGVPPRLLLSAHGLPEKIVRAGDPYPEQVDATARAVIGQLARAGHGPVDWRVCYQSRIGPLAWIGPSIDEEVRRAGRERVPLVVAPISFVSEHSETLVELDHDYRNLAASCGVPGYHRIPTVGTHPAFIGALAELVQRPELSGPLSLERARGRPADIAATSGEARA